MEITAEIWSIFFSQITTGAALLAVGLAIILGLFRYLVGGLIDGDWQDVMGLARIAAVWGFAIPGIIWFAALVVLTLAWLVGMVI